MQQAIEKWVYGMDNLSFGHIEVSVNRSSVSSLDPDRIWNHAIKYTG